MSARHRVCHVITGLDRAGAQRVLVDLLAHRDQGLFDVEVVSLLPRRGLADEIEALGVPVWSANLGRDFGLPVRVAGLARYLKRRRPDLVHTWMYHGDVIGGLAAKAVRPRSPVIWHLHHTTLASERTRPSTRVLAAAGARLSYRLPARILACAEDTRRFHAEAGYDESKMLVVRNGVDSRRYAPRTPGGPRWLHRELRIPPSARLVGLAARFHPLKDHATFLAAARRVVAARREVHFIMCGVGVDPAHPAFSESVRTGRIHALGERRDLDRVLPELDVSVLSSVAEACSLVLLESMASGVPCVTTDAGDSAFLVGSTGHVVPPREPERLADAILEVLDLETPERDALRAAARKRVVENFGLDRVAAAVEAAYRAVLEGDAADSKCQSANS